MLSHSQNFINNVDLVNKILSYVDFRRTNLVLEIGPGKGIITNYILEKATHTEIIEADQKFFNELHSKYTGNPKVKVTHADFLNVSLPKEPYIIVSNIPFNITSDIIRKITSEDSGLYEAYLIMQEEAGLKLVGSPFGESSLLSNILKVDFEISLLEKISSRNFTPKPRFDAVFVSFKKRDKSFMDYKMRNDFKNFLTYIYGRSRPLLKDALKSLFSNIQIKVIFKNIKKYEDVTIKQIPFEDWLTIFETFIIHVPEKNKYVINGAYSKLVNEQSRLQKNHRTRRY
jgi:23S rRNA (adenine-N6)-dimethyltransferase